MANFSSRDSAAGLERADRAERTHFGHAPAVAHFDAVVFLKSADHLGRTGRAADDDELERREFLALLAQVMQQPQPDGRDGGGHRHLFCLQKVADRGAVELRPRHHHPRPADKAREREAPGIRVEHRHDRQNRVVGLQHQGFGAGRHQRMQGVRAMRIEHALRVAGGAGGVAEPGGGALVELLPAEVAVDLADPLLIWNGVLELGCRHVGGVCQDDVALDGRQMVGDRFEQRHEGEIDHHEPVFRVIDDPGDLLREKTRVDGMIDCPDARDAVPGLEVAEAVPGKRRDPVAEPDPVAFEALGHFESPAADLAIVRPMHRALDHARCDFLGRKLDRGEVDDLVHEQGPFLHASEHIGPPSLRGGLIAARELFMSIRTRRRFAQLRGAECRRRLNMCVAFTRKDGDDGPVTDDWSGYASLRKRGYDHHAIAECGDPEVADDFLPIVHLVFANLKTWLNGTHHGVSHQHLQAYLNEFTFRFNRRFYP